MVVATAVAATAQDSTQAPTSGAADSTAAKTAAPTPPPTTTQNPLNVEYKSSEQIAKAAMGALEDHVGALRADASDITRIDALGRTVLVSGESPKDRQKQE